MKTYTPKNIEIFKLTATDFLTAGSGDWRKDLLDAAVSTPETEDGEDANEYEDERQAEAENLAGFYWWTCLPGCLPDGEPSGPFETELEAIEDAGGGEYEDDIYALAMEINEDPAEISEERNDYYGMKVLSCGQAEYAVGTEDEANDAWDQALDFYLDDCGVLDGIPENLRNYFDREAWKQDARFDGRGHALSSYDGSELDLADGYVAFRIN